MKDFGAALHEALQAGEQANIQANIELARTLAQAGTSAVDKVLALGRGAVDLMQEIGRQQIDAIEANAQAGVVASNKVAAAGVVGATAAGAAGLAAEGAFRYGKHIGKQAIRDQWQDAGDRLQRQFMPQRAAGNPCLPCLVNYIHPISGSALHYALSGTDFYMAAYLVDAGIDLKLLDGTAPEIKNPRATKQTAIEKFGEFEGGQRGDDPLPEIAAGWRVFTAALARRGVTMPCGL
jgi:hypothetical protein